MNIQNKGNIIKLSPLGNLGKGNKRFCNEWVL